MKNLLTLALISISSFTFAQGGDSKNNERKVHPIIDKIAAMMTDGMCDCFNKHAVTKLTPKTRKALDKMMKKNVTTEAEMIKALSASELMGISSELETLMPEEGDFADCQADISMGMIQYQGEMTEMLAKGDITEEQFQAQLEEQMVVRMKKNKGCETFYYLYLIGKKNGGE